MYKYYWCYRDNLVLLDDNVTYTYVTYFGSFDFCSLKPKYVEIYFTTPVKKVLHL